MNKIQRRQSIVAIATVLALVGLFLKTGLARATHVDPIFVPGNASCPAGTIELKVEPVADGTYSDGTLTVTIDVRDTPDGQVFDFTANIGIDAVVVKGGLIRISTCTILK